MISTLGTILVNRENETVYIQYEANMQISHHAARLFVAIGTAIQRQRARKISKYRQMLKMMDINYYTDREQSATDSRILVVIGEID